MPLILKNDIKYEIHILTDKVKTRCIPEITQCPLSNQILEKIEIKTPLYQLLNKTEVEI